MTQEEQILAYEKKLIHALLAGDIKILEELLHDSLLFNIPTGQTITKAMDIENYRSGILKVKEINTSDYNIVSYDNLAVVTVTLHIQASYSNQIIDGKYRYMRVWKLFGESWKIIAGSGTALH